MPRIVNGPLIENCNSPCRIQDNSSSPLTQNHRLTELEDPGRLSVQLADSTDGESKPREIKLVTWSPSRVSNKVRSRTALSGLVVLNKNPFSHHCAIGAPFSVFSCILHQTKSKILSRELLFPIVFYVKDDNVTH